MMGGGGMGGQFPSPAIRVTEGQVVHTELSGQRRHVAAHDPPSRHRAGLAERRRRAHLLGRERDLYLPVAPAARRHVLLPLPYQHGAARGDGHVRGADRRSGAGRQRRGARLRRRPRLRRGGGVGLRRDRLVLAHAELGGGHLRRRRRTERPQSRLLRHHRGGRRAVGTDGAGRGGADEPRADPAGALHLRRLLPAARSTSAA